MNNINDYVKVSEAAERLGCSKQAVNEMIRRGRYQSEKGLVYWPSVRSAQDKPLKKSMQSLRAKKKQ